MNPIRSKVFVKMSGQKDPKSMKKGSIGSKLNEKFATKCLKTVK